MAGRQEGPCWSREGDQSKPLGAGRILWEQECPGKSNPGSLAHQWTPKLFLQKIWATRVHAGGEGAHHGHLGSLPSPPLSPTNTPGSQKTPCVLGEGYGNSQTNYHGKLMEMARKTWTNKRS